MATFPKRLLLAIAFLLALQTLIVLAKYAGFVAGEGKFSGDFTSFWNATGRLRAGDIAGIYDPQRWRAVMASGQIKDLFWFVYPPFALFGLWPLGAFSVTTATLIWLLAPVPFCVALMVLLLRKSLQANRGSSQLDPARPLLLTAVVCLAYALPLLAFHIVAAQSGAVIAVLFMAAALCWHDKPVLAGMFIGAMAIKPQLGVLIPIALLAGGRWQTIFSAMATIAGLVAGVTLWLGAGIWHDYFAMTQVFADFIASGHEGIPHLAVAPYVSLVAIGAPKIIASLFAGICILMAVIVVFTIFRARAGDGRDDLRLAILAAAALIATPYGLSYDMPILIVAVVPIVVRAWRGRADVAEVLSLTAVVVAPAVQLHAVHVGIPFGMLALLAWFGVLLHRYKKEGTQTAAAGVEKIFGQSFGARAAPV